MTTEVSAQQIKIKNVHTKVYAAACDRLNISYRVALNTHALFINKKNGGEALLYKAITPLNQSAYGALSKNKRDTTLTLARAGVPVPIQERVATIEELTTFFKKHKRIVVKPIDSHGGKGITVLPSEFELQEALNRALHVSKKVVVETYVTGLNYRFLVLDGNVLAVALRLPPFVTGDGKTTLRTLAEDYNTVNRSKGIPETPLNTYTWSIIAAQGFSPDSIPEVGRQIYIRLTANLSQGGSVKDVTLTVHESYKAIASAAAKASGLRICGIDIISPYIDQPGADAYVIETNAAPGMRIHYKDENGAKLGIAEKVVTAIYELP